MEGVLMNAETNEDNDYVYIVKKKNSTTWFKKLLSLFKPKKIFFYKDGVLQNIKHISYGLKNVKIIIHYYDDNVLHRKNKPAIIEYYYNGNIEKEIYYNNGKIHRKNGPAIILYHRCGVDNKNEVFYYCNDELHREDGPARIKYFDNKVTLEEYYYHGKLHREDGPAIICNSLNDGKTIKKKYYKNDRLHNDNGPAIIEYNESGYLERFGILFILSDRPTFNVKKEEYYQNNKLHKFDGPAVIEYGDNNKIKLEQHYYNGIKFIPEELPFEFPIDDSKKELYFNLKHGV